MERAEAKVTVSNTSTGTVTDGTDFTYTVDGWTLDQTNKTSKLVRTIDGYATWAGYATAVTGVDNPYRFVGNVTVGKDIKGTQLYRVYWGDDYNYTSTAASGLSTVGTVPASLLALDKNGYCFENTVNLNGMTEQNLTRVIVKATFNEGQPFFVIDGNTAKMFAEADVKKEIAARVLAADKVWFESNLNNATINSETDFTVTLSPLTAGKVTVASVALTEEAKNKFKENTDFDGRAATWLTAANKTELAYYANGAAYYPVYVKHFGDELTPWADQAATSADIYPGGEQNYLGRYGMLRNNWYKINVQSIKSIGSPTVETAPMTIDKKESYISVTVNTLPWAVRTQNADL